MRRAVILMLLLGAMQLLRPLGSAGYGAQALLVFGFLVLAAYTVGELAAGWRTPKIVGYLVAGMLFGPSALDLVSTPALGRLAPVSDLAVALIAFLAGAELRWSEVRERGVAFVKVMTVELALAFVAIGLAVYGLAHLFQIPAGADPVERIAFSALFASIAVVHSPAVTMALLSETGARGPVARTTLGVVLLADVAVVLLFSATLTVARASLPADAAGAAVSVSAVVWHIGGALLVGAALGGLVALYLRFLGQELVLFALLVALLGAEVARLVGVETLLTLVTAGFVAENVSRQGRGEALRIAMERSAAPVFVVFFALAGARINLGAVAALLLVAVPVAAVRALAIRSGASLGARWAGLGETERRYVWMGLVSQAGVAIGLATVVGEAYPVWGPDLRSLLLAVIAVNETIGAILFRRGLVKAGELAPPPTLARPVRARVPS